MKDCNLIKTYCLLRMRKRTLRKETKRCRTLKEMRSSLTVRNWDAYKAIERWRYEKANNDDGEAKQSRRNGSIITHQKVTRYGKKGQNGKIKRNGGINE